MKTFRIIGIIVVALFILNSCNIGGDDPKNTERKFLVSYELYSPNISFDIEAAKTLLNLYGMGDVASKLKYQVKIYKVVYKTLFEGDTIQASGIVSIPVPEKKKETFSMLSYQHGTILKKSDAPSLNIDNEFMTYIASTGIVVVIPDYIGFGESSAEFHPYMMNQYTVNAVLDMIRASKELVAEENSFNLGSGLFMYGYSQGGSATLGSVSAIENNSANIDLTVTAAVCGAGAYDLAEMRKWIVNQDRYVQPYFIGYLLESYSRYADVSTDFSLVFSPEFASMIPAQFDGLTSADVINKQFGTFHVGELFNDNFENDSIFNADSAYVPLIWAFNENKIDAWPINTSLAIHYGSEDVWIPGDQSLTIFKAFQNNGSGAKVKLERLEGLNHETAFPASLNKAMSWFLTFDN